MFVKTATRRLTITGVFTGIGATIMPIIIDFALKSGGFFGYETSLWLLRYIFMYI